MFGTDTNRDTRPGVYPSTFFYSVSETEGSRKSVSTSLVV